ncbi:MAG: glycosyltransferase family 39 protein [Anaerolineales bacterium]|nr:glycosyltransferase family 39 protein [Anaerolineales bacterium]
MVKQPLEQRRRFLALLLLVFAAWALRAHRLGAQELRGDEAGSWNYVVHAPGPIALVERIIREGDPHPPLHYWVLHGWVRIFGDSEWMLRAPSALLSLLLVVLLYQFGARAASPDIGLSAAAIAALHPFQIWLAQDVRHMYQLAIIFGLLATLRLPGLVRGRSRDWWVYVASATLAMYSHYYALFGLVAHGAYVFAQLVGTKRMRWLLASGAVAMLVSPWAAVILPVYARGQLADPAPIPPLQFLSSIAADFSLGPVVVPALGLPAAVLGLILAAYGAAALSRSSNRAWAALLIAWPLFTLAGMYAVTTRRGTFNAFYFLVAFPAVYLLLAAGWRALLTRPHGHVPAALLALLAAVLTSIALGNHYSAPRWSKNRGLREVAEILQLQARAGDVFITNFPDPSQDYYLREMTLVRAMLPEEAASTRAETSSALHQLARQYQRMWFVPIDARQWDADATVLDLLNQGYVREAAYPARKLRLLRYTSEPASAAGSRSVDVLFAAGPRLQWAHVAVNGMPAREALLAGDGVRVTLLWSAPSASIEGDYIVFVHMLDSNGMLLASHDGTPGNGSRATSTWQPEEKILDVHSFHVPVQLQGERFTLSVGMYSRDKEERQAVVGGGDSVAIFAFDAEAARDISN